VEQVTVTSICQTFLELRDSGQQFPIYGNGKLARGSFDQLGELKFRKNEGLPSAKQASQQKAS